MCEAPEPTYVQWGRKECPSGSTRQYWGYVMANHYTQQKSEYICVDEARMAHANSSAANRDGNLLYTTEYQVGSLNSGTYSHDYEATCAVCGADNPTYTRWGHTKCPDSTETLYSGVVAGGHYNHRGSGANSVCLHPEPTYGEHSAGNQDGALLYGTEHVFFSPPALDPPSSPHSQS